ncbi:hypothetical protein ES703_116517 [subsurface metagenome]
MAKRYKLTCSQCGRKFFDLDRGKALSRLRKHLWKDHQDWMRRRIKAGIRKAKKASSLVVANSPFDLRATLRNIVNPPWAGFAEKPLIEKVTGRPYQEVKDAVIDAMVRQALSGITKGLTGK